MLFQVIRARLVKVSESLLSHPCHEIIRSVGPNLVFALLMDGPQLPGRWGARYASSLADDPGCSVLTLTSWGLVNRMNESRKYKPSRTIALWKDESGAEEIHMPDCDGPCGILLSLAGQTTEEWTLGGRKVSNWSWRFHGQQPIIPASQTKKAAPIGAAFV
jgi:hypothetical protein